MAKRENPGEGAAPQPAESSSPEPSPTEVDSAAPEGKKRFLLRLDPAVWSALEKWAADELRSVNSEIEFLLKEALKKAGRLGR
ncbi:MAG TPA: Arc family DNA-binding protein [Rectinemataceae bacterium]|nr:Arc family DNA-binding protein [Rectinemataceae bacterium]